MNWIETYRLISEKLGGRDPGLPSVIVPGRLKDWAKVELARFGLKKGERCIAVQIGVWEGHFWKQWPMENVAKLCTKLWKKDKLRPVFLGDSSGSQYMMNS